ncbi:MAG: diguanylate cyclase [Corticimicrobacter sp.]|uniref:GGDEF domain-containing protein n=1 Tax=Corticimicrobacter sp. TaxID=2678536 RepID=UPI0032DB83ED
MQQFCTALLKTDHHRQPARFIQVLAIFGVTLLAVLLGGLTRTFDGFSILWPANALLLGLFVRVPKYNTLAAWGAAALAYVCAEMLLGRMPAVALWLAVANLSGVAAGYFMLHRSRARLSELSEPAVMLHLFAVCLGAAAVSALAGCGLLAVTLEYNLANAWGLWFSGELLNYVMFLPLLLSIPYAAAAQQPGGQRQEDAFWTRWHHRQTYPLLALVASIVLAWWIGGPGAIAYPVLALLWCALEYRLFQTAAVTAVTCAILLLFMSASLASLLFVDEYVHAMMSLRMGVLLIALAPLTVSCVNAARDRLLKSLDHAVSYDALTDALSRRVFMERSVAALERLKRRGLQASVLMLDIDHFKRINDTYGHATGDKVLAQLAATVQQMLRDPDLFGRLGGEEFAVFLPETGRQDALAVAERLRSAIKRIEVESDAGDAVVFTASIGVVHWHAAHHTDMSTLLSRADQALYLAKRGGRDRVELAV